MRLLPYMVMILQLPRVPIYAWLDPVGRVKITKTSTDVVIASDASTANGIDAITITSHLSLPFLPLLLLFPFSHSATLLLLL